MSKDSSKPRNRLHRAAFAILLVGLLAAACVYIAAARSEPDATDFQIVGGQAYPVDSSREMQQLERLGGKASVQTFKFQRWFSSLWQGQRLAETLALLSVALAFLCWHLANLASEDQP
jgi:hypothetical protein